MGFRREAWIGIAAGLTNRGEPLGLVFGHQPPEYSFNRRNRGVASLLLKSKLEKPDWIAFEGFRKTDNSIKRQL